MKKRNPFHTFSPSFFSGLLDDPLLFIRVPPPEQNILVDCGQMHHLAKRTLKSIGSLFISHAHMDHFIGIDKFTRSILVSPKTVDLYGPPGISEKLAAKLAGYDWNLVENFYCHFRVHEVDQAAISTYNLSGSDCFNRRFEATEARSGTLLQDRGTYLAEGALCDHKIPSLIFRFTEKPRFLVDEDLIEQHGLVKGPWIREMKHYYYRGSLESSFLNIDRRDGGAPLNVPPEEVLDLYREIARDQSVASIGYVTDVGFTGDNLEKILGLLDGITLLVCECTYLASAEDKARRSYHLCTTDLNILIRRLRPAYILPMHLSKAYLGKTARLYEELEIPGDCTLIRLPERVSPEPIAPSDTPDLMFRSEQRN